MTMRRQESTDAKTGKKTIRMVDFPDAQPSEKLKGVDLDKLKNILLAKGIIARKSDIE